MAENVLFFEMYEFVKYYKKQFDTPIIRSNVLWTELFTVIYVLYYKYINNVSNIYCEPVIFDK